MFEITPSGRRLSFHHAVPESLEIPLWKYLSEEIRKIIVRIHMNWAEYVLIAKSLDPLLPHINVF